MKAEIKMIRPTWRTLLQITALLTLDLTAAGPEPAFGQSDVCGDTSRHFVIPLPGVQSSIWEDGTVSLAIPLQNENSRPAAKYK